MIGDIKEGIFGVGETVIEMNMDRSKRKDRRNGETAVIIRKNGKEWEEYGYMVPEFCSIFSIEAWAIDKVMRKADREYCKYNVLILSDSLSVLCKLQNEKSMDEEEGLIGEMRERIKKRNSQPYAGGGSNVDVKGNEKADRTAKEHMEGEVDSDMKLTLKDARRGIKISK